MDKLQTEQTDIVKQKYRENDDLKRTLDKFRSKDPQKKINFCENGTKEKCTEIRRTTVPCTKVKLVGKPNNWH